MTRIRQPSLVSECSRAIRSETASTSACAFSGVTEPFSLPTTARFLGSRLPSTPRILQRDPGFGVSSREPEILRHHANDGVRPALEVHGPSNDARIPIEAELPASMAQDGDCISAGCSFRGEERSSERGLHSEKSEQVRGGPNNYDAIRLVTAGESCARSFALRPSFWSRARYTSPIPPAPIDSRILQFASRLPGSRLIGSKLKQINRWVVLRWGRDRVLPPLRFRRTRVRRGGLARCGAPGLAPPGHAPAFGGSSAR